MLIFPYCLTDTLKSHHVLREDPETETYEGTTPLVDSPSFSLVIWRSLEVLRHTPRILNLLTLAERLYADYIMSQPFKVPANSIEALKHFAKMSRT